MTTQHPPDMASWQVHWEAGAIAQAKADILAYYPNKPESIDMAKRLVRLIDAVNRDPTAVFGSPAVKTDWPGKFRIPADPQQPVSAIADVDIPRKTVTVVSIEIRKPKGPKP